MIKLLLRMPIFIMHILMAIVYLIFGYAMGYYFGYQAGQQDYIDYLNNLLTIGQ